MRRPGRSLPARTSWQASASRRCCLRGSVWILWASNRLQSSHWQEAVRQGSHFLGNGFGLGNEKSSVPGEGSSDIGYATSSGFPLSVGAPWSVLNASMALPLVLHLTIALLVPGEDPDKTSRLRTSPNFNKSSLKDPSSMESGRFLISKGESSPVSEWNCSIPMAYLSVADLAKFPDF